MTASALLRDGRAVTPAMAIARDALRLGAGARLPTTTEYQETLEVGSGTVQKALRELRDSGALLLVARGHRGTYIVEADQGRLWSASGLPPVHVLLPPSSPTEALAIARAITSRLASFGAVTTVGFTRGAAERIRELEAETADGAIMSSGARQDLLGHDQGEAFFTLDLGAKTYYRPGSLVVVSRSDDAGSVTERRVGIDRDSDDHRRLTLAEFAEPGDVHVPTDFTVIPRAVLEGQIDVGIWHAVESLIPLEAVGLSMTPLTTRDALAVENEVSGAVLVMRSSHPATSLLQDFDLASSAKASAAEPAGVGLPLRFVL